MLLLPEADLDHIIANTPGLWEPLRGATIFLTGATGFVGSWLLASVLRANDELGLDLSIFALTRSPERFERRAPELARHSAVHLLEGDMRTFTPPASCCTYVIHAATERAFEPDAAQPLGTFGADVEGTRRVLEMVRSHGVRRLLFTSSGAVYGVQPPSLTHIPEDYAGAPATTDPRSAYGQAKRVSEYMCSRYGDVYGFDATIARLFAFVGPLLPLNTNFAVGNFIRDAMAGAPVRVSGDGTPFRSYLYAADLAIWLWTILLRGKSAYPYNVGSQDALTIKDLARVVIDEISPSVSTVITVPPTPGAPARRYVPDVSRAKMELGLSPLIPLDEAVRRTAAWHAAKQTV